MTEPSASDAAMSRLPINAALSSSERHNANNSSNWSITTNKCAPSFDPNFRLATICKLRGSRARSSINVAVVTTEGFSRVRLAARLSSGCAVGVRIYICQSADLLFQRKAGINPARTTDDFPLPDAPITARKRVEFGEPLEVRERIRSTSFADRKS